MTASLTWRQAAAWRVRRHHLHRRAPSAAALDVVSGINGLHAQLLSSADLALWQSGFFAYRRHRKGAWLRYFGVTPEEVDRLLDAITEALDGRTLTREELDTEVGRLTGSADLGAKLRESWGSLLKPAAFEGRLCFAPGSGQHVCFTRPDQWLPDWAAVDPATALPEITRRFFAAHGPATREDRALRGAGAAATRRAVEEEAERLAAFVGAALDLTWA